MVVCKYFLQGNCRFGDNCKNEHTYNDGPTSVLLKKPDVDINILIKAASSDMLKSEKGSQWPLTCYGPFQGKPCFPGFEDKSFEEVRLGYYGAQQTGTLEQYKQQLVLLLQETHLKMKSLQNPSAEATNLLKNLYFNTQNTYTNSNNFGNSTANYTNSIFGNAGTNQQTSNFSFVQPQESKNVFVNTQSGFSSNNSVFGNPSLNYSTTSANKNIFGGNTNQNTFVATANQNMFGTSQNIITGGTPNQNTFTSVNNQNLFSSIANTPNIFSNAVPNQTVFTSSANNQNNFSGGAPGSSIFTSSTQIPHPFTSAASNQSIFSNAVANQNIFTNTPPNQNAFMGTTNTSIFGNAQQSEIFGNQTGLQNSANPISHTQSIFGPAVSNQQSFGIVYNNQNSSPFTSPLSSNTTTSTSNTIFQQPNQFNQSNIQNSVFNMQNTNQSHSSNIFGNSINQNLTANVRREDDSTIYSKISDLTSNDIAQFESQFFDFGKIPVRAPPLEMC